MFDEEDLIFGDTRGFDAGDGPARGVDGDLAGFQQEAPLPFSTRRDQAGDGVAVGAWAGERPEVAIVAEEGDVFGDGDGGPSGEATGEGTATVSMAWISTVRVSWRPLTER